MNTWFTSNLGDPLWAGDSLDQIRSLFASHGEASKSIRESAVFFRHESSGGVHCELIVYFSPATASVARAVGALPCSKPSQEGLGLLAGSEESWSVLFPTKKGKADL